MFANISHDSDLHYNYLEDNTWLLGDMKFIFERSTRYLTSQRILFIL